MAKVKTKNIMVCSDCGKILTVCKYCLKPFHPDDNILCYRIAPNKYCHFCEKCSNDFGCKI